jgi:hypothetical protein
LRKFHEAECNEQNQQNLHPIISSICRSEFINLPNWFVLLATWAGLCG